jgi:hypothetical protein
MNNAVQVTDEDEMAGLIRSCLPALETIEAAFVRDCWLREPKVTLKNFSRTWSLSAKALSEVRKRVLVRLKDLMTKKGITSIADIV